MRLPEERQLLATYGRRMTSDGLVVGTSGNLSIRAGDLLAVTPSGHAYDTLTPELVGVHRLDGAAVEAELAPTSELPFHQLIYAHTDAAAVVHTHSTAATVVSTLVDELPTIHYILAVMGGPIRVAPYASFGSQELADNVVAAIEGRSGVLLANHGAITYGPTIEVAYDRALYLEWVAEVWLRAHSLPGFTPRILGETEMAQVYAKIQGTYTLSGRPRPSREDLPTRTSSQEPPMPAAERAFPDGFVWGTATAAHQVEGGNWNNDWWAWEHTPGSGCAEPSGDACDHWHRWPQDLQLLADLGFGSYRFSLEWSRVEPEEGEFSTVALDHYLAMCAGCRELGLEPVVTFHHFTTPRWVAAAGGWAEAATADRFARFCARAAGHLGDAMARACTLNEPNVVATAGYLQGRFPPGERSRDRREAANETFVAAHAKAAAAIKEAAGVPVGLTLAMSDGQAVPGGEAALAEHRAGWEDPYLEAARGDDFIGVQTYTRHRFGPEGMLDPEPGMPLTTMGYEFWPEALGATIRRAAEATGAPVLVTENGIATDDDSQRVEFVRRALESVLDCLADGVDVRGYTYWSLLDNFEWAYGYRPAFGLVAVDRTTQVRSPKPSATWLGQVARANSLAR